MMTEKEMRRITSYHEAGHAVVARILGLSVESISMATAEGSQARSMIKTALSDAWSGSQTEKLKACEIDIKVALAGPIAQYRYRGRFDDSFDREAEGDRLQAIAYAGNHLRLAAGQDDDPNYSAALTARLAGETAVLIHAQWGSIQQVAEALTVRDFMDQAELDALIAV
jgi:hypothetical protein